LQPLVKVKNIWWNWSRKIVVIQEIVMTNMLEIEALTKLLTKKGVVTNDELLEKIRNIRGKMAP